MPEGRINLEEGLEDSPQVRSRVSKLEKYLPPLKDYTTLLRDTFQACSIHQQKVCEGTDALSKLLNSFQNETMGEQETFIPTAFFRLGRYLSELHSCQEMLSTQLQNAVIELLSQFITNDFGKLEKLKETHEAASQDHEQAVHKFSRLSRKRDTEKTRFEANADLFAARRKFSESSLDYYSELNCFQHKKKFSIMEPLLTFMHAQMAYFKVGHEILNRELGTLLTDLNTEVQRVHEAFQSEVLLSKQTQQDIELQFPTLCLPDPDPTDPFTDQPLLPNTSLTSKTGYLFIRTQTGFPSKWDRAYFFTKKGYLYMHMSPKSPELVVHLKGAEAIATEMDDRRYVFVISHSSLKRPVYLLAESETLKEEWISTINNISYERTHVQPQSNVKRDEAVIRMEREKIRSWVNKEIDPKKDAKNSIPKSQKQTPPSSFGSQTTFPSLPSFLNFLDSSNQSDTSSTRRSPIFQRKSNANKSPERYVVPAAEGEEVMATPQPPNLPMPLQPERLTTGATPTGRHHFSKTFYVKYLGHMEVKEGRNIATITDTIQKVMMARAVRNVKDAQGIELTITHKSITLFDHSLKKSIGQIVLKDILRCAVQPENVKLFGIVNRTTGDLDKQRFLCHVMEADKSGSQVCSAVNEAIQAAIRLMQANKHGRSKSSTPTVQPFKPVQKDQTDSSMVPMTGQFPLTKVNTNNGKLMNKQEKSASYSNLVSVDDSQGAFPTSNSTSSSQSSINSGVLETTFSSRQAPDYITMDGSHNSTTTSIAATLSTRNENSSGANSLGSIKIPNGSSARGHVAVSSKLLTQKQSKPSTLTSAAMSTDYYQMPSSMQGLSLSSDTLSEENSLPSFDVLISSSSESMQFGQGRNTNNSNSDLSNVDSGYFRMSRNSDGNSDEISSSVALSQYGMIDSDPYVTQPSVLNTPNEMPSGDSDIFSELSSSDAVYVSSSSQQGELFNGGNQLLSSTSAANSEYIPAAMQPDMVSSGFFLGAENQNTADSAFNNNNMSAGVSSSSASVGVGGVFPGDKMELDDFDLPPLPDVVDPPPPTMGGYTGSIVTLGTARNK